MDSKWMQRLNACRAWGIGIALIAIAVIWLIRR
jgi:hypothetical protein